MHVLILANHRAIAAQRLVERICTQLRGRRRPGDRITRCRDLRSLGEALARHPDIVLAPLAYGGGDAFRATVATVRTMAPATPIVACCDVSVSAEVLLAARAADVDHFAMPAVDDVAAVVQHVLAPDITVPSATSATSGSSAVDELLASLPPFAARLMMASLGERPPQSPAALAALVGLSERTLHKRCARDGWPAPGAVLRYGQLLRGLQVAAAQGSLVAGAIAAGCSDERGQAAMEFRRRLHDATSGGLRRPLADGAGPLCIVIATAFCITAADMPARRGRGSRVRATLAGGPTLAPDGAAVEEGLHDRRKRARRA